MSARNFIIAFAVGVAVAAGIFVALRSQQPIEPMAALILPDPNPVPEFALLDQRGAAIDRSFFAGQWDLVFFGFTHCPDICPATLQILAAARTALEEQGFDPLPRIVLVSVDPERDTPESIGQYVDYFGAGNVGITGSLDEIRKLTGGLGIYFERQATKNDNYVVDHSAAVLVINPQGEFSALFGGPHVAENYVHDLPIIMGSR